MASCPDCEPAPYIIRFTEDRPNPLYRRICYTTAWGEVIAFAVLNAGGLLYAIVTGEWRLKQMYEWFYFPIAGTFWALGALGLLPRVKASTKGEGHERRYFYGSVWAVTIAQPVLWFLWKALPRSTAYDILKLVDLHRHPRLRRQHGAARPAASDASDRTRRTCRIGLMKGHEGWDDYAAYYDWENAQTVGRRDIAFWSDFALRASSGQARHRPRVLELGCGTGRVAIPLAKAGATVVGIDRSASMLDRGRIKVRRARVGSRVQLIRGDIRHLPFPDRSFPLVMAPYGILQSLLDEQLLSATLKDVRRVLTRDGIFGLELVADLPAWDEYSNRVTLRSQRGPHGTADPR